MTTETSDQKMKRLTRQCHESNTRTDELVQKHLIQIDPTRPYRYDLKRRDIIVVVQTYMMELNQLEDKKKHIQENIGKCQEKLEQLKINYHKGYPI